MTHVDNKNATTVAASSRGGFLLNAVVIIVGFAIFAIILAIAYLPRQADALTLSSTSNLTPQERAVILADLRAKEKAASTTYGWVDQTKGIVRLPIERAVELTIQEHSAQK